MATKKAVLYVLVEPELRSWAEGQAKAQDRSLTSYVIHLINDDRRQAEAAAS